MTDHLKVVLENHRDSDLFHNICWLLVRAAVPSEIFSVLHIGRLTALQKANGGIRGIVAGDLLRRLVARTMAQQLGPAIERSTAPFQCALTTRAGTECIAHAVQALTDVNPSATVLSIDGIGAFDLVSRQSVHVGGFAQSGRRGFSTSFRVAVLRFSILLFMGG